MQAVTITLGTPVVYGSESIAQLEFKRPVDCAGSLRRLWTSWKARMCFGPWRRCPFF